LIPIIKVFEINYILKFQLYDSEHRSRTDLPFEIFIYHLNFEIIIENWKLYWEMVARVSDPIDGWGGGPGLLHQVKSTSCTPPTPRDHIGQKRRVYVHDPVEGWEDGGEYPRPRQVKSCHITTPIIAYMHSCPSKNPDWTIKAYLLADQALCITDCNFARILQNTS
jgi:hypothetical protein